MRLQGPEERGGAIRVGLFDSALGYAMQEEGVLAYQVAPARSGSMVVRFADLQPGRYAVKSFHDANENRILDRALGLVPLEGVALSNDPLLIGAPPFDDLAVDVEASGEIVLRFRYPAGG